MAPRPNLPGFGIHAEGELVVNTLDNGVTHRVTIGMAGMIRTQLIRALSEFDDAIAAAGGINPKTGLPAWRPARRRKQLPPTPPQRSAD